MALLVAQERSPLDFYITRQRVLDAALRKLLQDAADLASQNILATVGKTNVSSQVSRAQQQIIRAELLKIENDLWGKVEGVTQVNVQRAVTAGYQAERWMASGLLGYLPPDIRNAFVKQQRVAAVRTAELYLRRGIADSGTGHSLSARVYKSRQLSNGSVDRMVRTHILAGSSARDLARAVKGSIKPDSPGGVSYSAMRLARTEINNAFHLAQIDAQKANPAALGAVWHLSERHDVPDDCNMYAERNMHKLGVGVFPVGEVPRKPHPNCLCFLTTKLAERDEFIAAMRAELGKT